MRGGRTLPNRKMMIYSNRRINNGETPGEFYRNVYPLFVNKTVYEGLRKDDPDRRAMILTRSGFSGIQRYSAVTWSGDVGNDWETLVGK